MVAVFIYLEIGRGRTLIVGSSACSFPAANKDWLRGRRSAVRFFHIRLEVSQIQIAYTSSMLTLTIMSFVNCSLYVYLSMELREDIAHCCVAMGLCEMREEFKRPGSTGEVCIRNVGATKRHTTCYTFAIHQQRDKPVGWCSGGRTPCRIAICTLWILARHKDQFDGY